MDFQLTEDQVQIRSGRTSSRRTEIRPVAAHYDETEEFPWPVLKRAHEVGLYGLEFYVETLAQDSSGLVLPDRDRGAVLGLRRHLARDLRQRAARCRRSRPPGLAGAAAGLGAEDLRHEERSRRSRRCA